MNILLAFDESESSREALEDLATAALPENPSITILACGEVDLTDAVGGAIESLLSMTGIEIGAYVREERDRCDRRAELAKARVEELLPMATVNTRVEMRQAENAIVEFSEKNQTDLIVMGSHGRGTVARTFLGSVSLNVLVSAPCSVRIVKSKSTRETVRKMVIGTDGSKHATDMIAKIAKREWSYDTIFSVVYVNDLAAFAEEMGYEGSKLSWNPKLGKEAATIANEGAEILRAAGLKAEIQIRFGQPKRELIAAATSWEADAIYIAAHGLGKLERMVMGSVSKAVATYSPITVEVVR